MSKFKLPLILVVLAAICMPAIAGEKAVKRVPEGAVAFHFVYDLSFVTNEFVGYIAFIEGIDYPDTGENPLFNGQPSEQTAYFTIRLTELLSEPDVLPVPDTELTAFLFPPGGQFTVYFDSSPGDRDWGKPDTFAQGVPIAVFDESALLNSVGSSAGINLFSSRLVDSTPIYFNGQRINFKRLVPNGVTITNFGNGFRFTNELGPGASGGGTAIAIGGKRWHKSHDDDSDD